MSSCTIFVIFIIIITDRTKTYEHIYVCVVVFRCYRITDSLTTAAPFMGILSWVFSLVSWSEIHQIEQQPMLKTQLLKQYNI